MDRSAHWDLKNDSRIWAMEEPTVVWTATEEEPMVGEVSSGGGGAAVAAVGAEN